jgi:hypothetical protein
MRFLANSFRPPSGERPSKIANSAHSSICPVFYTTDIYWQMTLRSNLKNIPNDAVNQGVTKRCSILGTQ